jgi:xanthine/CO dehydrogenase XdhC/CoxF family maturation factor
MKELADIAAAVARYAPGGTAVLATLMKVAGSAYRGPGARMVVLPDDSTVGAISGGCLEKDVVAYAERVRRDGKCLAVAYDLTSDDDLPWGLNMGCAARLDVFLESFPTGRVPEPLAFVLDQLAQREPAVVATLFRAPASGPPLGARLMATSDGTMTGDIGSGDLAGSVRTDALRVLREARSDAMVYPIPAGEVEVLVEYVPCPVALVICGAGGDATPLARLASSLGWQARCLGKEDELDPGSFDDRTAVVIMTHNYGRDLELLGQAIRSRARYVGVLGPRGRTERLLADIGARGTTPTAVELLRLHAPIGLDIGAETPEEIALAIAAEIRSTLGDRPGGKLRERKGPIHDRR